jgi:hypothetical protein
MRRGGVTAGELLSALEKDPAYRKRAAENEARRADAESLLRREQQSLIAEIRSHGWQIDSIWDLVNTGADYRALIPTLIDHLLRPYHPRIKEGIARALTVKQARPVAAEPLIKEFLDFGREHPTAEHSKWAIGHALALTGDDSVFDQVAAILRDKTHGWTRSGMIDALPKMRTRREEAFQLALELAGDEDATIANDAMIALGNFRDLRGRPVVESFLQHPDSWVRQRAKQALAKIDRKACRRAQAKPH